MSPSLQPMALESISSVMEEQSVPQPYSFRILIKNGFALAFTAKYSLNPLFQLKASFTACAFCRDVYKRQSLSSSRGKGQSVLPYSVNGSPLFYALGIWKAEGRYQMFRCLLYKTAFVCLQL